MPCRTGLVTRGPWAPDGRRGLAGRRARADRSRRVDATAGAQDAEAKRQREASYNTVKTFAERYLRERGLRPTTVHNYRGLLATRINPYFGEMPLKHVTLSEIKAWRASLTQDRGDERRGLPAAALPAAGRRGGGAHRPRAAEDPRCRAGAGRGSVAVPATLDEIAVIVDTMPDRLQAAHRAGRVRRPARRRAARAAPLRHRRRHRPDQRQPQGRQGRDPGCPRRLPALRPRDQRAEDGERGAHRSRPAAVPADAAEAPARARRRRPVGTALSR